MITQNDKLQYYFTANPGRWLAMPELAKVITPTGIGAAVHSRVSDLRTKRGMNIEQKGTRKSQYRFIPADWDAAAA